MTSAGTGPSPKTGFVALRHRSQLRQPAASSAKRRHSWAGLDIHDWYPLRRGKHPAHGNIDPRMTRIFPGDPSPLGCSFDGIGANISVFSEVADAVDLCLFD